MKAQTYKKDFAINTVFNAFSFSSCFQRLFVVDLFAVKMVPGMKKRKIKFLYEFYSHYVNFGVLRFRRLRNRSGARIWGNFSFLSQLLPFTFGSNSGKICQEKTEKIIFSQVGGMFGLLSHTVRVFSVIFLPRALSSVVVMVLKQNFSVLLSCILSLLLPSPTLFTQSQ